MQDVAAGGGLGEQVCGGQSVEGASRIRRGRAGERGDAEPVDVRARVMAERRRRGGGRWRAAARRRRRCSRRRAARAAGARRRGRRGRGRGGRGRGVPRAERRPAAQLGFAAGRLGLGCGAVLAEGAGEQRHAVVGGEDARARTRAASEATRPVRRARLVTTVTQPGPVGSSGRTWAEVRALSRRTSRRSSAVSERNRALAASADSGIRRGGTSRATRNSRSSSAGSGSEVSLNPRRSA